MRNALEELRIVLEAILKPVVFRLKTYEYPSGLAMSSNDDVFLLGSMEIGRQVVLNLR
jgi:hypothetical protein